MKSTSAWVLASCLLVACGGDDTTPGGGGGSGSTGTAGSATGAGGNSSAGCGRILVHRRRWRRGRSAGTSSTGGSGGSTGAGGTLGASGAGGAGGSAMLPPGDENLCGDGRASRRTRSIAAGKVTTVCAGATITVSAGVNITVQGTLRVDGTAAMPAKFQGAAHGPQGWAGHRARERRQAPDDLRRDPRRGHADRCEGGIRFSGRPHLDRQLAEHAASSLRAGRSTTASCTAWRLPRTRIPSSSTALLRT